MGGNRRKSHTLNSSGRSKKRKYCGNRHSKTMSEVTGLDYESDVEKQPTTHKIYGTFNTPNDGNGFRIVDFDILSGVISQCTCCMVCHSQTLQVKELEKKGMSHNFQLCCATCEFSHEFYTSGNYSTIIYFIICNFNVHNK